MEPDAALAPDVRRNGGDVVQMIVAAGVLLASGAVARDGVSGAERRAFELANRQPNWLEPVLWLPMQLGSLWGPFAAGAFAWWRTRSWRPAAGAVVVGVVAWQLAKAVKGHVERGRPLDELGDIVFVELPKVGRALGAHEVFGVIESVKTASDLFTPVAGTVTAVNDALNGSPESVNAEPYGTGWMLRIRPDDPAAVDALLTPHIALHGYAISRPPSHGPLPPVRLTLVWHTLQTGAPDLKVSARLLAPDGRPVAQADAVPVHFAYPTTAWRAGEFISDGYDLPLPGQLPAGAYTPLIILYDPAHGAAEVGRVTLPALYLP